MALLTAFAMIASVLASADVKAQTLETSVPYTIDYDGWITIKATVNGKGPYDFILDTGATLTLAFENLASEQSFTPSDEPPRRILGLNSEQEVPVTNIGDIQIGSQSLKDHVGVVLADWEAPRKTPQGVLGLDFLEQYLIVIDIDAKQIRFYDPKNGIPREISKWRRANLRKSSFNTGIGALYTVRAKLNNGDATFILDLGASGTLINFAALRALAVGLRINPSGLLNARSRISDISGDETSAKLVVAQSIKIGGTRWRRTPLLVYNAEIFDELGVKSRPFGLLGADLMTQRSFAIDFPNENIYIKKSRPRKN